ncbi:MAG TPA: UDP-2,3-diacylglucosamine diphosphatase [Gemmatimonadales bacterium]|nr:UDP-2,3-diacylglucosamine diphosphatase [Gemmatimonadales bacterium]
MPTEQLVIVADAHLGATDPTTDAALLDFLSAVPELGDSLLINGDLFDFWFAYRQVIPRRGFQVAAELSRLARQMPVMMTGGNHDRWGDSFWEREVGIRFSPSSLRFDFGGRTALAIHGDGIAEAHRGARVMHWITKQPVTSFLFRLAPPDLTFRLVDRMSTKLGDSTRETAVLDQAAARQLAWATDQAARDPALGLIVMGHTHRTALHRLDGGAWYVNPGAWLDGGRYAIATPSGVDIRHWAGAPTPPRALPPG